MKKAVLKLSSTSTSTPFKLGAVYRRKGSDNFYILVAPDSYFLYSLINLSDGCRWDDPVDESRMQKELDENFHLVAARIEINDCLS